MALYKKTAMLLRMLPKNNSVDSAIQPATIAMENIPVNVVNVLPASSLKDPIANNVIKDVINVTHRL